MTTNTKTIAGTVDDLLYMLHPIEGEDEKGKPVKRDCITITTLYEEIIKVFPGVKMVNLQRLINTHFSEYGTTIKDGDRGQAQAYFIEFDPTHLAGEEVNYDADLQDLKDRVTALEGVSDFKAVKAVIGDMSARINELEGKLAEKK